MEFHESNVKERQGKRSQFRAVISTRDLLTRSSTPVPRIDYRLDDEKKKALELVGHLGIIA
jgi:hypothetical protein